MPSSPLGASGSRRPQLPSGFSNWCPVPTHWCAGGRLFKAFSVYGWDIVRVSAAGTGGWKLSANPGQEVVTAGSPNSTGDWTPRDIARNWNAARSSADGTRLFAVFDNVLAASTDSGITWMA